MKQTQNQHTSLAALYRPQNFAQVAGQHMVTTVLSRAAAEDSVAPAYLLSGTRGVGKTTIARIFAKALNCLHAPAPEPCNTCEQCRQITQGHHVDVAEIDGASNNSVEDARALRETIGFAPMEGRYKIFIIDEAHMLSKSAFNALLKTLEEPPPRVVFIFATTEAHKFPITIISRCQHFIFKRLSEDGLIEHLTHVLTQENVGFDSTAVRLIARRAAGSVRDSMSLLGQTLAYDEGHLTMEATRQVLGLAGQELFSQMVNAIRHQDCAAVVTLCQTLTGQGVDIGFFLRELAHVWRTLFLLREAGDAIIPTLNLAEDEVVLWRELSKGFTATHVHAAWHMTLEAQRKVIHSPEPAAALELLLLNLTLMPRLLPIGQGEQAEHSGQAQQGGGSQNTLPQHAFPASQTPAGTAHAQHTSVPLQSSHPRQKSMHVRQELQNSERVAENAEKRLPTHVGEHVSAQLSMENPLKADTTKASIVPESISVLAPDVQSVPVPVSDDVQSVPLALERVSWEGFCAHLATVECPMPSFLLRQIQGSIRGSDNGAEREIVFTLTPTTHVVHDQLFKWQDTLQHEAHIYCQALLGVLEPGTLRVDIMETARVQHKSEAELKDYFFKHDSMQACLDILDARILRVRPAQT